jgi:hypothetical protein
MTVSVVGPEQPLVTAYTEYVNGLGIVLLFVTMILVSLFENSIIPVVPVLKDNPVEFEIV